MSMTVRYWGVRGSLPSFPPPKEMYEITRQLFQEFFQAGYKESQEIDTFLQSFPLTRIGGYGGATTCVEVETEKNSIIIDCGSGLRGLGEKLMNGPCGSGQGEVHIFMTHFHWDHLIGLPFFIPIFIPGNKIHFYAVQPELEKLIRALFWKPNFPVPYEALQASIEYHQLPPREPLQIDDMKIIPYELDHPDPCWGYRIESAGKAYAHCVDTECTRMSRKDMGPDLPLYQNCDLLYFDAQYSLNEAVDKANWGHSAASIGIDIAFREEIKYILFTHHDPGASYENIAALENQTAEYYEWIAKEYKEKQNKVPNVKWDYAYEGMEIPL